MSTRILLGLGALLALAACEAGGGEIRAQGYVEGDYLNVAPQVTARIDRILVTEGDSARVGEILIELDARDAKAARARAVAQLAAAEADQQEAEATLRAADREYHRQKDLRKQRVSSVSALDDAQRAFETAQARVLSAAKSIEAARAQVAETEWQVGERTLRAPADGIIEEVYYRPGEVASAGRPVLSLLPPANRKIRFFVSETDLAAVSLGTKVTVRCDGCPGPIPARVTFIAREAQYTPPVIYSFETRKKLVFLIEAHPSANPVTLNVGQPVDVTVDRTPEKGTP